MWIRTPSSNSPLKHLSRASRKDKSTPWLRQVRVAAAVVRRLRAAVGDTAVDLDAQLRREQ
jgi:hypothetical protein